LAIKTDFLKKFMSKSPKTELKTDKSGLKIAQILNVKVNITYQEQVINTISNFLARRHKFCLFSVNPELLVMAAGDPVLKKIINSADLVIPDGIGLRLAIPNLPIIKGRQLFLALMDLAKAKKWRTFLLGGKGIKGVVAGPRLNRTGEPVLQRDIVIQNDIIARVNRFEPDLLFVGFGMPKQEYWIYKNAKKLNAKCVMAVGGTFDYVFGKAKVPPARWNELGLEWLWRLICQPWRIARIFNATVVFPLRLTFERYRN